jgi:hypothetical protein
MRSLLAVAPAERRSCVATCLHFVLRQTQSKQTWLTKSCNPCVCCAVLCRSRVSIVRELHVYGTAVAVHARDTGKLQHQGYGSLLMAAAERIALQVRVCCCCCCCCCCVFGLTCTWACACRVCMSGGV